MKKRDKAYREKKSLSTLTLQDLKQMTHDELAILCGEIRDEIMKTVSSNGGHLSSNLGVVELTVAIHRVFNSPKDKILFDVSHQCYTHKLLTKRNIKFSSLRQRGGMSGFYSPKESDHDPYEAGHSSTSISAGIGILNADPACQVISVIGDASVTNGLAFEALNHLGSNKNLKMIIIINDNEMSISKNVGTLARTFNKIRVRQQNPLIYKVTPKFMHRGISRLRQSIKSLAYQKNIFEALDFKYFEGIDGHNIKELERYLNFAKEAKNSVVLHVKTKKGRGYKYAEEDNTGIWHNTGEFAIASGQNQTTYETVGEVISSYLTNVVSDYPQMRVITPGMSLGSGLDCFKATFPDNFIDVGIAEEHAIVLANSMAQYGLLPIVFIYSTFLQRAYDQLVHDIARTMKPVIFCIDRAGIVPGDGDSHQGIFDIAYLKTIPYLEIVAPATPKQAILLVERALKRNHPTAIRYPKYLRESINVDKFLFEETWQIIYPLNRINVVTYGSDLVNLADLLEGEGVGLINAWKVNIIDEGMLKRLDGTVLIIYEQVIKSNSLAQSIAVYIAEAELKVTYKSFALGDIPQVGTIDQLKEDAGISYTDVLDYIKLKQ